MSQVFEIEGGRTLSGTIKVGGAKNAALPLMIASLLTGDRCVFHNVPALEDVRLTLQLLETFGAVANYSYGDVVIETPSLIATEASYSLVKALRASFWVLSPLLARGGAARVALPGGDAIGARPVDLHLAGLQQMGAEVSIKHGVVFATAKNGLKPANIHFRFPSVGATHQLIMAAALTPGTTTLENVAKEPEVVALADLINKMGGDIEGAGSDKIIIRGKKDLHGAEINLIGDRIEGGTYLLAALATQGSITLEGINPEHFGSFLEYLDQMGVSVATETNRISVKANGRIKAIQAKTAPFPLFATDLQAPLMAALTMATGTSTIEEHIFEGRFGHASELCRMGADISISEHTATIRGVERLTGARVDGLDIRAAAALVIAGLAAEGTTTIHEIHHLKRGYEHLEQKLKALGANVKSYITDAEDFMFTGC